MSRRPTISPWRNAGKVAETSHSVDEVVRDTGWVFNNETGSELTLAQFVATGKPEVVSYFSRLDLCWNDRATRSVVEIGSGIGRMTAFLTTEFADVVACDLDAAFLERCRETVAQFGDSTRLKTCQVEDGHTLHLADASHDVVFSYITLQHCQRNDALALVREALRITKPGGKVALNFRTWTPQDALLIPSGKVVRMVWRLFPALSRAPRFVTRFGWQANRLSPNDVVPVVTEVAPTAQVEVYQAVRRTRPLASPVPTKQLDGTHPSHWWLVVTKQ